MSNKNRPKIIGPFVGEYEFLDNFYPSEVRFEGLVFPTVENAFQSVKCENRILRQCFVGLRPGLAKILGREVALRKDWESCKVDVMRNLVEQKFSIPNLAVKLVATNETRLVELNTWGDEFWGICEGKGKNLLGRILMETRAKIQKVYETPYTERGDAWEEHS